MALASLSGRVVVFWFFAVQTFTVIRLSFTLLALFGVGIPDFFFVATVTL